MDQRSLQTMSRTSRQTILLLPGGDFGGLHAVSTTTILRPFFWDHPGEPVSEENFWTLWCKGRLTEADTMTIRLSATPSRLTSSHLHHPPYFFTDRMPFLPPNQQCQSTEGVQSMFSKTSSALVCFCFLLPRDVWTSKEGLGALVSCCRHLCILEN